MDDEELKELRTRDAVVYLICFLCRQSAGRSHIASNHQIWPRDTRQLSCNIFECLIHYHGPLSIYPVFSLLTHFSLSIVFKKNDIHTFSLLPAYIPGHNLCLGIRETSNQLSVT